jgi:hypothetical protein
MNVSRRLVLIAVVVLAACGSGSSGVSKSAGALLHEQVGAIRIAAGHADRDGAAQQLAQLLTSVGQLRAKGELSKDAAARIRHAAAAVQAQLSLLPAPTTTTTTTTPPPREQERNDHGPGQRKDHHPKGDA